MGLATALLASLAALAAPDIDFEAAARDLLQRYGIEGADPKQVEFETLLSEAFVHVRLGALDVYYPAALLDDKARGDELQGLCRHLLQAQSRWLDLVEPLGVKLTDARKDLKAVDGWVKSWNASKLRNSMEGESLELTEVLKAKDKVREALDSFADTMGRGVGLPTPRAEPRFATLVLAPTRLDFVELVCFGGFLFPMNQGAFWDQDAAVWLECRIGEARVLALEFADPFDLGNWKAGMRMDARERTGLEQHVVQRGFYTLMGSYFGGEVNQAFTSGLAIRVVIDLFEEDNTRSEGDLRGNSKPDWEVFIPGGNPLGGVLPGANVESRFRENKGGDYFVRGLRQAQKQGAEDGRSTRDKLVKFLILADDEVERYSASAPFLGKAAKETPVPPDRFVGDYKEFYRAYKACFVNWLMTEAGSSPKDSAERFAKLLAGMIDRPDDSEFESLVPEIYDGAKLSSIELDEDTLEGRFLRWLQRQG